MSIEHLIVFEKIFNNPKTIKKHYDSFVSIVDLNEDLLTKLIKFKEIKREKEFSNLVVETVYKYFEKHTITNDNVELIHSIFEDLSAVRQIKISEKALKDNKIEIVVQKKVGEQAQIMKLLKSEKYSEVSEIFKYKKTLPLVLVDRVLTFMSKKNVTNELYDFYNVFVLKTESRDKENLLNIALIKMSNNQFENFIEKNKDFINNSSANYEKNGVKYFCTFFCDMLNRFINTKEKDLENFIPNINFYMSNLDYINDFNNFFKTKDKFNELIKNKEIIKNIYRSRKYEEFKFYWIEELQNHSSLPQKIKIAETIMLKINLEKECEKIENPEEKKKNKI